MARSGVGPFHQKSTCLTQLAFGQMWSRNTPKFRGNETLELNRDGLFCRTSSGVRLCWELEEPGRTRQDQDGTGRLTVRMASHVGGVRPVDHLVNLRHLRHGHTKTLLGVLTNLLEPFLNLVRALTKFS